ALVVLRDVAVGHPDARVRHVEEYVDGLAGADEHGVLPDEVRLRDAVTREDEEPPSAMNVEGVRHRMVGVHTVDEPDLHLVTYAEVPVDPGVLRARGSVDQLPAHVRRGGDPVDLDHVVFPLDALSRLVCMTGLVMLMAGWLGPMIVIHLGDEMSRPELHPAFR